MFCALCRVYHSLFPFLLLCFSFNDPSTTDIYTLSLHDALPISHGLFSSAERSKLRIDQHRNGGFDVLYKARFKDRKSTRLNSSHVKISYAVFCLKKKNKKN